MNSWIDATQSLPEERESVRFVVVGHRRSLAGIYENQLFCSRWGSYEPAKVELWRKLGNAPRGPRRLRAAAEPQPEAGAGPRGRTLRMAIAASSSAP